jgi:hypothetical protein
MENEQRAIDIMKAYQLTEISVSKLASSLFLGFKGNFIRIDKFRFSKQISRNTA